MGNLEQRPEVKNLPEKRNDCDNSENGTSNNKAGPNARHDFDLVAM